MKTRDLQAGFYLFCTLVHLLLLLPVFAYGQHEQAVFLPSEQASGEFFWIDAGSDLGELHLNNGFLHSRDEQSPEPNYDLVHALAPEEWRLYKANSYQLAVDHGANITYGLANHYAWYKGGYPNASPWEDWAEYEAYILYNMQVYDSAFPDYPVEYYDIWNEPDHPYFWHGTYNHLLELYQRAYRVIKSYNPEAKVVGPSISWFRPGYPGVEGIIDFLVDLDTMYDIRLDAVSWHENGGVPYDTRPDGIPTRAQYLRYRIIENFPPDYTPEFHVNEFMGGTVHLSPGWNVGFLYYLEKAGIDKAMRACWNVYSLTDSCAGDSSPVEYWSDCWYGLNGMLMKDGQVPQPAYWVCFTHALMEGSRQLDTNASHIYTNVIATRDPVSNVIRLLTGRYMDASQDDIYFLVNNYLYTHENVLVNLELVPHYPTFYSNPPQAIPLAGGPLLIDSQVVPVSTGYFQYIIEDFADGEAYIVTIVPPPEQPVLSGPSIGKPGIEYDFTVVASAPDESDLYYYIDWGDGTAADWIGPFPSGEPVTAGHAWPGKGVFQVRCMARAQVDLESEWSESLAVRIFNWGPPHQRFESHLKNQDL